ncbi:hypothetical protein G6F56_012560 [Rhizopus delemar]|nr:hypothetical protein G6F56_012560 [Rhizopus delemar]
MQLDEDVGKVAQATPILIYQSCQESRSRSAKRLTVAHLKKTIETVEQFDFLKDIVASIPDPLEPSEESGTQKSRSSKRNTKGNKEEQ